MKFLVDLPLSPALAAWLRGQGHDAVHAVALRLHRSADSEILALARATEPGVVLFRGGD